MKSRERYTNIGKRVPKLDALDKATGKAVFPQDIKLPGMLYGKILWSKHAHAEILKIETSEAEKLPGVVAVITAKDMPPTKLGFAQDNPPLKGDKVRSFRDEVAAVAAVDEYTAEQALELIKVKYKPLPAVFDPEEAMKDNAPQIHAEAKGNRNKIHHSFEYGDVNAARASSDVAVKHRFRLPFAKHCCLAPWSCVASWDAAGKLTMYSPTQMPFLYQRDLAKVLQIPTSMIRVIQPKIGGGFGTKLDLYPNEVICAALAKKTGRPVKLTYTREEEFKCTPSRQPVIADIEMGAKKDGSLTFRDVSLILDNGAYTSWGATTPYVTMIPITSLYKCKNVRFKTSIIYTNNMYSGAMRGYGNPQGTFIVESMMDALAEKLGMDALKLRLKNCNEPGEVTPQGMKVTTCGLRECIETVAGRLNWTQKRNSRDKQRGAVRRGIGVASYFHVGGGARVYRSDGCGAIVKVDDFGHVTLITGSTDMGQGSETVLAQITAEELGVRTEDVTVVNNDSAVKPWDLGSHASRTTFVAGNAARDAAAKVKAEILKAGSEVMDEAENKLEINNRKIYSKTSPDKSMDIAKVIRSAHFREQGMTFMAEAFYDPPTEMQDKEHRGNISVTYGFGTQGAEVEVDTETGQVNILKIVIANDVGRVINPMLLEGQLEGGLSMGIGYALLEKLVVENGEVMNPSFLDYKLPTVKDMPPVEIVFIETNDPSGPFGEKGAGESGVIPTAAAIGNAVADALGFRIFEIPMLPEV
ncbi:MAG: xanthine dehydrogenase family protein molybdopterin-binding subunit, partial [Candidatus Aminicenantaceae bacterium]